MKNVIKAMLIDFGGVIAEEGFYLGLSEIGKRCGLVPEAFFTAVNALIYETGYLTGRIDEASFWHAVRSRTGITPGDAELRQEILKRFVIRPEMIAVVDGLRSEGLAVALLSDQTNWLDEINAATALFDHFDRVFNSWHIRKSKRDATVFGDVCAELGLPPGDVLFVDDNIGHIKRARLQGLRTLHFVSIGDFKEKMKELA